MTTFCPPLIYRKELKVAGIEETKVVEAARLINERFGAGYLEKEDKLFKESFKGSFWKFSSINPLYELVTNPQLENIIQLLEISECLSLFEKQKSMPEYLARMKDVKLFDSAVFELMIAKEFYKRGFFVELQKPSASFQPIEIYARNTNGAIWIECKTNKETRQEEPLYDKITRRLTPIFQKLPSGTAIYIDLWQILDGKQLNEAIRQIGKVLQIFPKISHQHRSFTVEAKFGDIKLIRFAPDEAENLIYALRAQSKGLIADGYAPEDPLYKNLPDTNRLNQMQRYRVLAINYPIKIKNQGQTKIQNLVKDLKGKIVQQKKLISTGDEVMIIFKSALQPEDIGKLFHRINPRWEKYKNLSIIAGYLTINKGLGKMDVGFVNLITSVNPPKIKTLFLRVFGTARQAGTAAF